MKEANDLYYEWMKSAGAAKMTDREIWHSAFREGRKYQRNLDVDVCFRLGYGSDEREFFTRILKNQEIH